MRGYPSGMTADDLAGGPYHDAAAALPEDCLQKMTRRCDTSSYSPHCTVTGVKVSACLMQLTFSLSEFSISLRISLSRAFLTKRADSHQHFKVTMH